MGEPHKRDGGEGDGDDQHDSRLTGKLPLDGWICDGCDFRDSGGTKLDEGLTISVLACVPLAILAKSLCHRRAKL